MFVSSEKSTTTVTHQTHIVTTSHPSCLFRKNLCLLARDDLGPKIGMGIIEIMGKTWGKASKIIVDHRGETLEHAPIDSLQYQYHGKIMDSMYYDVLRLELYHLHLSNRKHPAMGYPH